MISVGTQYLELEHQAESVAMSLAQSQFTISPKSCLDLQLSANVEVSSCEIGASAVSIKLNQRARALGKTWQISAESRVGYGFYSQNSP
jgi:hypothetical protein